MRWGLLIVLCSMLLSCSKQVPEQKNTNNVVNQKAVHNKQVRRPVVFSIPHSQHVLGNPKAFIPIVMFTDFHCAKCARAYRIVQDMLKDPAIKEMVSVSLRHYPQRKESIKSAKASLAAGLQGSPYFWRMAEKLFSADGEIYDEVYLSSARQIGLDVDRFSRDMVTQEEKFMGVLRHDAAVAQSVKNAGSTPGIFIGGHLYRGPLQREPFKKFIYSVKRYNERAVTPGLTH